MGWWKQYNKHKTVEVDIDGEKVDVDVKIAEAVKLLNELGSKTAFSCQGSTRMERHRGAVYTSMGYISLQEGYDFPESLKKLATRRGLALRESAGNLCLDAVDLSIWHEGPKVVTDDYIELTFSWNRKFIKTLKEWVTRQRGVIGNTSVS
jgi:hypothetical protein